MALALIKYGRNFAKDPLPLPEFWCASDSPEAGVDKMLKQDKAKVADFPSMYLNTFPGQNAETIRLEEAVFGSLSILNLAIHL